MGEEVAAERPYSAMARVRWDQSPSLKEPEEEECEWQYEYKVTVWLEGARAAVGGGSCGCIAAAAVTVVDGWDYPYAADGGQHQARSY